MKSENQQNSYLEKALQGSAFLEPEVTEAPSLSRPSQPNTWQRYVARPRMDLSNLDDLQQWSKERRENGEAWLIVDLKGTRFMSLPVIGFLETLSLELRNNGGALALLSMPDKTRRIFEIYGSLKNIYLVEKVESLKNLQASIINPFFQLKNI